MGHNWVKTSDGKKQTKEKKGVERLLCMHINMFKMASETHQSVI